MVSAAVFFTLAVPLSLFGAKTLNIKIQDESVFFGELKEFSPLYMRMTGVASAAAGIITLALIGWRHARRKSDLDEVELANLEQSLKEKQQLLEMLKLSESQLQESDATGLVKLKLNYESEEMGKEEDSSNSLPEKSQSEIQPVVQPLVITENPIEIKSVILPMPQVSAATTKFTSAQNFLGYDKSKNPLISSPIDDSEDEDPEVDRLETQLEQIVQQIASLQKTLRSNSQKKTRR
ncbi:MAG TPA: hypothetical protein DEG17_17995 [Cyanobacteria bacterium UBA11149]|nr:hypothetical protein [Cyanobacteria bacterium UBA11367]HBE56307.1 hypothetical protein [Cyanobacteria bacterium UBA11366]HBK65535.1 hypothetical protein [Cyanobacteria bacterium UBA11166]HBR75002.1 hypothetical protein [Cyanobacteria bacterium UBA11159]HBS70817.1 hypothetical protein [Cyanobacteria bacterium UBA11153]HBW90710.1 hypothetical protein [Cyanobacteria bacterium UBA11149]HCA94015.1 hypothetical protein [Cyanobacteria bacterium UBA9226]